MRFFISYTGADTIWAEWLAQELEQAGHAITLGACDPEQEAVPDLAASLACDCLVLVWSPQYLSCHHASAQREQRSFSTLVVRVRECPLPLAEIGRCLDLVGLSGPQASAALLRAVESEVAPAGPVANKRTTRFPGVLPKIWDLPCSRNNKFVGKDKLLKDLRAALASGSMTTLVGPGGIGKTQTALEYAYRYASAYDKVFWIRAGQNVQLTSDYVRLAAILFLPEQNITDQPKLIRIVHDWLSCNPGWLLIFDDVLDPDHLKDLVPSQGGHVLVTARCWSHPGVVMEVPAFSLRDTAVYLGQSIGSSDPDGPTVLGDALAHNPLALSFAAAMINRRKISIAAYCQLLPAACTNSPDAVDAAGQACLDAMSSEAPEAWALVRCAVWMSLQNISKTLLHSNPDGAPAFPQHLALLESYSLLETSAQAVRIHRSIRDIVQARLSMEEQRYWVNVAAERINQKFPSKIDDFRYWPVCSRLMPHVMETLAYAEQMEPIPAAVTRLLNQSGLFELRRGQYSRAEQLLRRALRLGERMYGQGHPKIATYAGNLSSVLKERGHVDEALVLALRALHIDEEVFGETQVSVAVRCGNLGQILQAKGDLHGALSYYRRALEVGDRVQGQSHQQSAIRSYNLAQALMLLGDFHGAARFCLRAVQIARETYGENHAKVADFAGALGQIHRALGDLDLALQYARQAVSINKDFYAPDHWKVAASERHLDQLTLEINHAGSIPKMVQAASTSSNAEEPRSGRSPGG